MIVFAGACEPVSGLIVYETFPVRMTKIGTDTPRGLTFLLLL